MAKSILQYDLLISCPGDAADVVPIVNEVVNEFNQQFTDALGIGIRTRYWQYSAFAESGGKPQDMLNRQIVDSSDLAIAIFKTRFGSPTEKYGSGTEEEIDKMISSGKQVFMFFDESPTKPSEIDQDQYRKVQEFKDRYKDRGIYWTYSSPDEFKNIFRAHITMFFMNLHNKTNEAGESVLVLKAFNCGKIQEQAVISKFDMGGFVSGEALRDKVIGEINRIKQMPMVASGAAPFELFMDKKVELDKSTIDIINGVAEKLEINLNDSFFDIGDLSESPLLSNIPFGGRELKGTTEEKEKYNAIVSLKNDIYTMIGHIQMEQYYDKFFGVELLISNDGTNYDEDIDIEIFIPKGKYIDVMSIPVPTEEVDLDDDWCFADIFEIPSTKDFIAYINTKKESFFSTNPSPVNIFGGRNYEEEYRETLNEIFEYGVYENETETILKVHFDYLKQHQTAAFPTWIFFDGANEGFVLKYKITSKNSKDIVEREMEVKAVQL